MKTVTVLIVILAILAVIGGVFLGSWILMLLLGAIAHVTGHLGLALSYWACVLIHVLLSFVGGFFRSFK